MKLWEITSSADPYFELWEKALKALRRPKLRMGWTPKKVALDLHSLHTDPDALTPKSTAKKVVYIAADFDNTIRVTLTLEGDQISMLMEDIDSDETGDDKFPIDSGDPDEPYTPEDVADFIDDYCWEWVKNLPKHKHRKGVNIDPEDLVESASDNFELWKNTLKALHTRACRPRLIWTTRRSALNLHSLHSDPASLSSQENKKATFTATNLENAMHVTLTLDTDKIRIHMQDTETGKTNSDAVPLSGDTPDDVACSIDDACSAWLKYMHP